MAEESAVLKPLTPESQADPTLFSYCQKKLQWHCHGSIENATEANKPHPPKYTKYSPLPQPLPSVRPQYLRVLDWLQHPFAFQYLFQLNHRPMSLLLQWKRLLLGERKAFDKEELRFREGRDQRQFQKERQEV
jgi:hypothetical protein